jgi:hypothetical protein
MIRLAAAHAVRVSDLIEHELRASILGRLARVDQ